MVSVLNIGKQMPESCSEAATRVLVTGTRSPAGLDIARRLVDCGHTVVTADSTPFRLCKKLKWVSASYKLTSPCKNARQFIAEMNEIIKEERICYVIPSCEETYYLAFFKQELQAELLAPDFKKLRALHSKERFIEMCQAVWQPVPTTFSYDDFAEELEHYIVKKKFSRFGLESYCCDRDMPQFVQNQKSEYIAQEFIDGEEISCYAICVKGQVNSISVYRHIDKFRKGAAIAFESIHHDEVREFVSKFAAHYQLSGQISFDFIQIGAGDIYPIECNPRATSGVHLYGEGCDLLSLLTKERSDLVEAAAGRKVGLGLVSWLTGKPLSKDVKEVFASFASVRLIFNQLVAILGFAMMSLLKFQPITLMTVIDIQWDGEQIR